MVSGADEFFGLTGDSHRSARFASRKELKKHQGGDGVRIGRNSHTGQLLRYDGPAHLITLAPTRAGKGVGTVISNLLGVERSVLIINPKGENDTRLEKRMQDIKQTASDLLKASNYTREVLSKADQDRTDAQVSCCSFLRTARQLQ